LDGFWEFAFLAKDVAECGDGEEAGDDFGSVHHPPKGDERVYLPKEFVQHKSDGSRQDSAKFGEGMFYRDGDRFRVVTANPELTDPHRFLPTLRATKRHSAFPLSSVQNLAEDFNAPILEQTRWSATSIRYPLPFSPVASR
jgi:hypothetical protein